MAISEPAEFYIHIRIHRDRPEIMCVAHLHAPNSTLLGIVNRPIVPVFSQAFFLHKGIPVWDNPRLVVSDNAAAQLSQALGNEIACQMRGHGSVVVGKTPEEALWNCFAIEENARYQIAAEPFGGPVLFSQEIIEEAAQQRATPERNALRHRLIWNYFERKVVMTGTPI
jgi:ribulose-5-phosphate 4-epimerase/fuculose-1-phosphate aldolase